MKKLIYAFLILSLGISCKKDKVCPAHYTGDDCNIEIEPASINLRGLNVNVTSTNWDVIGVDPDIYFVVTNESGSIELLNTAPQLNVTTASWAGNIAFNTSETCRILIYDYDDLDADDLIGSFVFDLYQRGSGFQTDFSTTSAGVELSVKVEYVH